MKIERIITKYRERPTAFNGFWLFIAEITGVMENHCRKRHQQYQTIRQVQFDGAAIVECSYCPRHFWKK
jgi:hypothetical protein